MSAQWVSEELAEALAELTARQARGVLRIVEGELAGHSLGSLLRGPGKVCAWGTFHGSGQSGGWKHKPAFAAALRLARRDMRAWAMEGATGEALEILTTTGPDAARLLRQRVVGDGVAVEGLVALLRDEDAEIRSQAAAALGATGLPMAAAALVAAWAREWDEDVRGAMVAALGQVAGGEARDMAAAREVLARVLGGSDKVEVEVEVTGVGVGTALAGMGDEELRRLRENLEVSEREERGGGE